MRNISLIPYVCGAGASVPGAERGPVYCFDHDIVEKLKGAGISAHWTMDPSVAWQGPYGHIAHTHMSPLGGPERLEMVDWHLHMLATEVENAINDGDIAVTIGGDHSLAAGSIAGLRRALGHDVRIGVIWVDAHADINTEKTTLSHALHGMPVATLLGIEQMMRLDGLSYPVIKPEDLCYLGLRDVDPGEYDNVAQLGMTLTDMTTLRGRGIVGAVAEACENLAKSCDFIAISIDIDGFSTDLAPATGTQVPGGFLIDEIIPPLAKIIQDYPVPLIDVVEFNPSLPGADKTFQFVIDVLTGLFSK